MNYKSHFLATLVIVSFAIPSLAFGQNTYKPLVGIPGVTNAGNFSDYINALYALSISVAALMAVIKIIIAGVKYMLSDVVTDKGSAINDIRSSVIGLIIVISAVLILTEINPKLTETEIFLSPVAATRNTPAVVQAGATETGTGYTTVPIGTAGFEETCIAGGGNYRAVPDGGGKSVCHPALPADMAAYVENTFKNYGIDTDKLKERWQLAHYPRMVPVAESNRISTAEATLGGNAEVLLAVELKEPIDFIDRENQNVMGVTCRQYAQVTGKKVTLVGNPTKGYLACVVKPAVAIP